MSSHQLIDARRSGSVVSLRSPAPRVRRAGFPVADWLLAQSNGERWLDFGIRGCRYAASAEVARSSRGCTTRVVSQRDAP